jgi:hypothetical protein
MTVIVKRLIYPTGASSGSATAKFVFAFSESSWVLSGGYYVITISALVHGVGTNPSVKVYINEGGNFSEVETGVRVSEEGNVTIAVSATPDNRFDGKLTIL